MFGSHTVEQPKRKKNRRRYFVATRGENVGYDKPNKKIYERGGEDAF